MCLLDLLAGLRSSRACRVVLGDDGPLAAEIARLGVPCEVLPMPARLAALGDAGLALATRGRAAARLALATRAPGAALSAVGYVSRLRRLLRAGAPDLVQTNGMKAHVLGAWAAPRGVPVVWHLHDYVSNRVLMRRLLRGFRRRGTRAVAVSRSVDEDAARALSGRLPISTIYNAVDLDRFHPGPADGTRLDSAAGLTIPLPDGHVRVGLVATMARWKGHEVFLDAVARLPREVPARFYVVGGSLYKSAGSQYDLADLKARASSLGLDGRVGFTGHQADPALALRSLDVVVHASTRPEPFGRVIVEAMACGKAVVASPIGGAAELFEDGVNALASPPGDAESLASTLSRLIADADLRGRLGAAGRAAAVARFDRDQLAEAWSRVHDDALRAGKPARDQRAPWAGRAAI